MCIRDSNNNDNNRSGQYLNNEFSHVYNTHSMHADHPDYNCDIEDEDEFENNTTAMLQHYIIVWLSILTSPKGNFSFAMLEILVYIKFIIH